MVDDARARQVTFLNTYLVAANMLKSDAVTPLVTHVMYDSPEVPLNWVFNGSGNDALFCLGKPTSTPLFNHNHTTYAYKETVPITIWTKDDNTVNGNKALWQCEAELRRIVETNFGGSLGVLRSFEKLGDNEQSMGAWRLFSAKYNLEYKRTNENYTPTYPKFGYGVGWNYDGNRVAGGTEGTWVGTSCTPTVDSGDFLKVTRAGGANATATATITSLALSASLYTKIRFRYKCEASTQAKIVVTGSGGTQTVLADTNTTTLTVVTVSLNSSLATLQTFAVSADTTNGSVYLDFVEVYEGDYILPNCTKLTPPGMLRDATLKPFGMLGSHTQAGGSELKTVNMTCDLDCEGSVVTWKRPQTGSPTDKTNTEVFELLAHELAKGTPWVWLDWGRGAMKARLSQFTPNYFGDNTLELEWTEYRLSSAGVAHENYRTRTSMDQVV